VNVYAFPNLDVTAGSLDYFLLGRRTTSAAQKHPSHVTFKVVTLALLGTMAATLAAAQTTHTQTSENYQPITGQQRLKWFVKSTVGPESLAGGLFSSGIGTARDKPVEYGPHWGGYADRYGMRLTGVSTGNAMEAGFGALWGEDPRYFQSANRSVKGRIGNVVLMTFAARQRDGQLGPAYARFIATPGNNFLSNAWRADSEANSHDAALRTLYGFLGRMGGNAFQEFWPEVTKRVFHRKH
jgi:hypothetical protein